jgi:carbamoyltransferase
MVILGLHREPWHDTGAAILVEKEDHVDVISITQERLDRVKDSRAYPGDAIAYCMREMGIKSIEEIDLIVTDYIEVPVWNRDRIVKDDYHPLLHGVQEKLQAEVIKDISPDKIAIINHHQAHAASAFYASPFDSSAVLVVDGRGSDRETQSIYFASRKDGIRLLEKSDYLGLGLLYATITVKIGFGILNEGKTMGLAPYGNEPGADLIDWNKRRYERVHTDFTAICGGRYDLLVPTPILTEKTRARLAFEVQEEIERGMSHLAYYAKKITGSNNLCIAGGVGLNSVANYHIFKKKIFDDIFIQPACSDTGIPLGCALHGYYQILKGKLGYNFESPYLGRSYSGDEIWRAIKSFSGFEIINKGVIDETVNLLAKNKVIGWFQGKSEIGPRALGARSILMNPGKAENKDILNAQVKHREAFRPFAPAVLEEVSGEYFDIDCPSPYMLLIADVREEMKHKVPAITHFDGTARLQTVSRKVNEKYYDLIRKFGDLTGIPILLNTSFNVAGEPIVETPQDAIRCYLNTGIDALCMGDYLLIKK